LSSDGTRFVLDAVGLTYRGKAALSDLSLVIEPGEIVAFVGPSGAGKTSALQLLNGSLRPTGGRVLVDGRDLAQLTAKEIKAVRTRIGFVHQDLDLVPNLRVVQNVLAGRLGRMGLLASLRAMLRPRREEVRAVHAILERVGIPDKLFQRTDRLSGGQRQRVATARALYQDAKGLLVDEPVSSLDPARSRDTIDLLTRLARENRMTLVASMHDIELARAFFPRLIALRAGRILFDRPATAVADEEFAALYRLDSAEMLADGG
jgi:phosphonate transport system ATP-binding protein